MKLLPYKLRKIGWAIALIPFISAIIIKIVNPEFIAQNKDILIKFLQCCILVGLLIVIVSKSKLEDEYLQHCRNKSFIFSFLATVTTAIINISGILYSNSITTFSTILTMQIGYLGMFYLQTWNILQSEK
ncbi:MAG: hypothetical protein WBC06_04395 [Chitinophagaceae bacterium]